MDIGKPEEVITIEPLELPDEEPAAPKREKQPEKVPA